MANEPKLDWVAWHRPYDEPNSNLARRLAVVQEQLRRALDERTGSIRLVSMCAGQGRDVIPVLAQHARRDDVTALLVELDPENAAAAEASARGAGLTGVRVLCGDAALTDSYAGAVPADIVLACGIFGNISEEDIKRTVEHLPRFCAAGATVLWTRGRWKDNDPTPQIRRWFEEAGFEEIAFEAPDDATYSVGVNRLVGAPQPLELGVRLFSFFR
jgi:hypothetical protein